MTFRTFNKLWRPGTATLLGVNLFIMSWLIGYGIYDDAIAEKYHSLIIYIYSTNAALFGGLAGIRQFDKHKQHSVARDISMANYGYDPRGSDGRRGLTRHYTDSHPMSQYDSSRLMDDYREHNVNGGYQPTPTRGSGDAPEFR